MKREFVEIELFMKTWAALKLTDDELKELQDTLLNNPSAGVLIKGTGGARKIRIAFQGHGKSGSGRVVYVDFAVSERIYLLMVYPKSKQGTLTDSHKQAAQKFIIEIYKEEQRRGKR